jgi:hypothetical protein
MVVDTTAANCHALEELAAEETPAWITSIQQKGKDYRAGRDRRAKENERMLSEYTRTEQSIARFMGVSPWDIDREQLRIWGLEADGTSPSP